MHGFYLPAQPNNACGLHCQLKQLVCVQEQAVSADTQMCRLRILGATLSHLPRDHQTGRPSSAAHFPHSKPLLAQADPTGDGSPLESHTQPPAGCTGSWCALLPPLASEALFYTAAVCSRKHGGQGH